MKQAHLVERRRNPVHGGTYEIWDVGDGHGIYVDYDPYPYDTGIPETMAFSYNLRRMKVADWDELDTRFYDATGGEAMRDLGYEPIEEDEDGTD